MPKRLKELTGREKESAHFAMTTHGRRSAGTGSSRRRFQSLGSLSSTKAIQKRRDLVLRRQVELNSEILASLASCYGTLGTGDRIEKSQNEKSCREVGTEEEGRKGSGTIAHDCRRFTSDLDSRLAFIQKLCGVNATENGGEEEEESDRESGRKKESKRELGEEDGEESRRGRAITPARPTQETLQRAIIASADITRRLQQSESLAEQVSQKIRRFDRARVNVNTALRHVAEVAGLKGCLEGLRRAIRQSELETAARHISHFREVTQRCGLLIDENTNSSGNNNYLAYKKSAVAGSSSPSDLAVGRDNTVARKLLASFGISPEDCALVTRTEQRLRRLAASELRNAVQNSSSSSLDGEQGEDEESLPHVNTEAARALRLLDLLGYSSVGSRALISMLRTRLRHFLSILRSSTYQETSTPSSSSSSSSSSIISDLRPRFQLSWNVSRSP